MSQTQAPQASEKLKEPYRGNPKLTEAKKSKIASDVYNEILEDALLQTRKILIDTQDGMQALKEEYNWQIRNNQRLEKALHKVQDLSCFEALKEKAGSFEVLRDNCQSLAKYIDKKINKTIDW